MHTHTNARFIVVVGLPSFSVTDDEVFLSFLKRTYNPPADADLCWKNSLPKLIFIILQRSTAEIMQHVASTHDACLSWYFYDNNVWMVMKWCQWCSSRPGTQPVVWGVMNIPAEPAALRVWLWAAAGRTVTELHTPAEQQTADRRVREWRTDTEDHSAAQESDLSLRRSSIPVKSEKNQTLFRGL